MRLSDDEFRAALQGVLDRSGRSKRALSVAMGRDIGYIAALLDPSRPSRARPTPEDLLAASNVTGIPFVELLDQLWAIPPERLADEVSRLGLAGLEGSGPDGLTERDRATLGDFAAFLVGRHRRPRRRAT